MGGPYLYRFYFSYLVPILQLYKISSWLDIKDGTFKSTRSPEEKTSNSILRFTCAGDGEPIDPGVLHSWGSHCILTLQGHHGWLHWFNSPIPDGGRPCTDVWPDVSSCSPSELFPAPGLKNKSGEQTFLFSSRNAKTVQRYLSHNFFLIYALKT